jgi:acyl-CoA synthetase (AMP-forming)/AMP-acid ligase II
MVGTLGVRHVHAGYGLTETTGVCTITRADDPLDLVAESSGRPITGVEIRIVDPGGEGVPSESRGEILVRGPGTMAGYLDDEDATRAIVSRDGWLSTGDVGWVDDAGNLRIVDRLKDMIIVGGFNTSPAEIERALEDHTLVAQSAVVGIPDDRLGEVPCAFVVRVPGAELDEPSLLAWAKGRLAGYKVPRRVEFVGQLPLTAVGKVDKQSLSDTLRSSG